MVTLRAQVILKTDNNITENFVTNSWAFESAASPNYAAIAVALKGFYDDLVTYFPTPMAQSSHEVKFYELPGVKPNYPVDTQIFNLASNPNQTPFPSEVAVCLSFQGERVSGFPQARRRGRVYIGPLGTNSSGTDGRPSSTFIGVLVDAAEALEVALAAITPGVDWVVWSPTEVDRVAVADGWVDNAWDTQRRRGIQPTSRATFTI